jgi:hypothetical protein
LYRLSLAGACVHEPTTPGCRHRIPRTFVPHEFLADSGIAIDPVDFRIMLNG